MLFIHHTTSCTISYSWLTTSRRVKGKVIIVTGVNSVRGIGRASAHQFAQNGARAVYLCDFSDQHLEIHQREIRSLYPTVDVHVRRFDASDEASVKAVVDDALDKYGRLDVFFANAAVLGQPKIFTDIEADELVRTLKTNVLRYERSVLCPSTPH